MSYNVFADMGLPNPEMELLKCQIVQSLGVLQSEKGLSDDAVARLWDVPASEVPRLLEGYWDDYTVERLFQFANALGRNVRITIDSRDAAPGEQARTLVLTG